MKFNIEYFMRILLHINYTCFYLVIQYNICFYITIILTFFMQNKSYILRK